MRAARSFEQEPADYGGNALSVQGPLIYLGGQSTGVGAGKGALLMCGGINQNYVQWQMSTSRDSEAAGDCILVRRKWAPR